MNPKILLLFSALILATPLFAREKTDVLVMRNGDRITCEIKGIDSDTLYIKVDYILSTLSLDWSKVDHVESNQLFMVKTQDGLVYSGTISTPKTPGERPTKIEILEAPEKAVSLEKSQVIKMDQTSRNFWQRFNGEIGAGLIYSKANQSTFTVKASLLPAISDPGRIHFTLNSSYYVKVWSNLKWNIAFYGNWDSHPPLGFAHSDYGSSSGSAGRLATARIFQAQKMSKVYRRKGKNIG